MNLPETLGTQIFKLRNGMHAALCHRPNLHRISIMLNVNAGCRDEILNGTAHMLEHLIFRGTEKYPSLRALSEAFETRGADFNAFTAREVTSFEIMTPPESLYEVLDLLSDAILHPKLTGIAAERDIIREEILADYDAENNLINDEDLLIEEFYGAAGSPIAGNPDDLDRITKEDVQEFYAENYCADRVVLVMVGPLGDIPGILAHVERSFEDMKREATKRVMRPMTPDYAQHLANIDNDQLLNKPKLIYRRDDGATQSDVSLGFLCDGVQSKEFYILSMLVRVLDDGMASRLSRRMVEELALVYDAEACLSVTRESTLMQIRTSCRHRRVLKVIDAVYELLKEIVKKGVSEEELDRIKRRVLWEHIALFDGSASLCSWISSMLLQNMAYEPAEFCSRLIEVTSSEICGMADKLLKRRDHVVSIVGELGAKSLEEIRKRVECVRCFE